MHVLNQVSFKLGTLYCTCRLCVNEKLATLFKSLGTEYNFKTAI